MLMKLDRDFFSRSSLIVAPDLIGSTIVTRKDGQVTTAKIVETEAYPGYDPASHTFGRESATKRTEVQYGQGGNLYMYLIMGLHTMTSVVTNQHGTPDVVFIRAAEPLEGLQTMKQRRSYTGEDLRKLTAGPGILSQSLGLTRLDNGVDVCSNNSPVHFFKDSNNAPKIETGLRINLGVKGLDDGKAQEAINKPWRFYDPESKFLSLK